MDKKLVARCIAGILFSQAAGIIGAQFTAPAIPSWYVTLVKPALTPPNYVFAPVWITLYTLMGIAFGIVWHNGGRSPDARIALGLFAVQLLLNIAWTAVFFGLHMPFAALFVMAALWLVSAKTASAFKPFSRLAASLFVPYLAWLTFAAYLNAGVWLLNR